MIISIFILALAGFMVSLYAYIVEQKLVTHPNYKPACDLSDRVSCSKPIRSHYGKIFLISNGMIGILFYLFVAILALFNASTVIMFCAIAALIASSIMAYILYAKIQTLCLICTAIYSINILIFMSVLFIH